VLLTEKVSSPAETRVYVWGLGLAYSRVTTGGTTAVRHVYHADGLGSVRALTDAAGLVTDTYVTDPYGVPGTGAGSSTQPFGYTGEQRDGETGFMHLRARGYDPATGRFLQRDPVAGAAQIPSTLNRYAYVLNNPVNYTDPSGLRYVDFNVSVSGPGLGLTGGFMKDDEGRRYAYLGLSASGVGGGASVNFSPGEVTEGWNTGLSGQYGLVSGQVGTTTDSGTLQEAIDNGFVEAGIGIGLGVSLSQYHVWEY
jgi:RHS repeat-associated protein